MALVVNSVTIYYWTCSVEAFGAFMTMKIVWGQVFDSSKANIRLSQLNFLSHDFDPPSLFLCSPQAARLTQDIMFSLIFSLQALSESSAKRYLDTSPPSFGP